MENVEHFGKGIKEYLEFVDNSGKFKIEGKGNQKDREREISNIVQKLFSKQKTSEINVSTLPVLSCIANNLNNSTNYQSSLLSLFSRSPKSQKSNELIPQICLLKGKQINIQVHLLYQMGVLLKQKALKTSDKQFLNNRANEILKSYEGNCERQVYQPLLIIATSSIGENHYMSAEGMIGFFKGQGLDLLKGYKSEDKKLKNNIYRMLVTRGNKKCMKLVGQKKSQFYLVIQLLGHSFDHLIL